MAAKPEDIAGLFAFYADTVKPLYNTVQLTNSLPQEVLFELNAALDHIARIWNNSEDASQAIDKAYSHLKRSCLDIFKIAVKQAIQQFEELRRIDTSIIDNGDFDRELMKLINSIRVNAMKARAEEGVTKDDGATIRAFELWGSVFADCVRLEKNFMEHERLDWARKKQKWDKWRERLWGFIVGGVVAGFISAGIYDLCKDAWIERMRRESAPSVVKPMPPATKSD